MRPLRMAIAGVGKIARDQHLPAIASDPGFELVATVDPQAGVADVPNFASLEALTGDRGARDLLADRAAQIVEVETRETGVHLDVDTPEELSRASSRTASAD